MTKATDALRASRAAELPLAVVEAGTAAYRRCVEEKLAPPMQSTQVHAVVVRIYRAMRAVEDSS